MGDQSWKKLENYTMPFLPENIPSPHQLTLERAEGVAIDRVKKLLARVSAIFLLPVFEKSVIFNDFRAIVLRISAREVVIRFAGKLWLDRGQSTTV